MRLATLRSILMRVLPVLALTGLAIPALLAATPVRAAASLHDAGVSGSSLSRDYIGTYRVVQDRQPRPDLAGARLWPLVGPNVYLVNPEGFLQLVPDPATYNNLFIDWNGITRTDIANIALGPPLSSGAMLAKGDSSPTVWVISNGVKRGVTSPEVMTKYYFNWNHVMTVPQILIDSIPSGSPWT